ncbi:hypothetical protein D9M68_975450 [compost metagenome]
MRCTSAARTIRLWAMPEAMAASECIEQGATSMPVEPKEPLAMLAPISSTG